MAEETFSELTKQLTHPEAEVRSRATAELVNRIVSGDVPDMWPQAVISAAATQPVVESLWKAIHQTEDVKAVPLLFASAAKLVTDDQVIDHTLADPLISQWKRSVLFISWPFAESVKKQWGDSERPKNAATIRTDILRLLEDPEPYWRETAADWLAWVAKDIPADSRDAVLDALWKCVRRFGQGFKAIYALNGSSAVDQLLEDGQVNSKTRAWSLLSYAPEALEGRWNTDKAKTLDLLLAALEDERAEARTKAARWLGEKVQELPENTYDRVAGSLEQRLNDDNTDVQVSTTAALNRLRLQQKKNSITLQVQELRQEATDEDQVQTIQRLAQLPSREALRALVGEWVQWIARGDRSFLMQAAAEAMRTSLFAVLPLVEVLDRGFQPDQKLVSSLLDGVIGPAPGNGTEEHIALLESKLHENARAELHRQRVVGRWDVGAYSRALMDTIRANEAQAVAVRVNRVVARQLSDMSDPRFFDEHADTHSAVAAELRRHALPILAHRVPEEGDLEIRESLTRLLANLGGREAVDALVRAVLGDERTGAARQELRAKYYLEPSRSRGEEAARLLTEVAAEAKQTLRILQVLNISLFVVGLAVLAFGLGIGLTSSDGATRVAGALAAIGGLGGVIFQLVRDPLDRIQNSMANLVQLETAFTSFIWELNLNGTYIQSKYVAEGVLNDDAIAQTVTRIEGAMTAAMSLVALYTEEGGQHLVTRINKLEPAAGPAGGKMIVHGQCLTGDRSQKKESSGLVAINHTPVLVTDVKWDQYAVSFKLPPKIINGDTEKSTVWISLFVDGIESNALPFHVLQESVSNGQ